MGPGYQGPPAGSVTQARWQELLGDSRGQRRSSRHAEATTQSRPPVGGSAPSIRGNPGLVFVRRGRDLWDDFLHATELDSNLVEAAVILDYHNVVDTMSFDEAADLGTQLDSIGSTQIILCSYAKDNDRRTAVFNDTLLWAPLIHECDGYVFTDYPTSRHLSVDVYQDAWMIDLARERFRDPSMCIGVRGDKGQVAALIGKPCILFDDQEDNIDLLRERSTDRVPLDGFVVRRGRKHSRTVSEGFSCTTDCELWPGFGEAIP